MLCAALSYGNGYPRQENGMLYGLVNRADDIAEDSTITCALVTCPACTNPVAETDCKKLSISRNILFMLPLITELLIVK